MKLFVVGEESSDPKKWSIWSEYALVIAESANEAEKMVKGSPATEIPIEKPVILVQMTEPNWGEDL